jgi:DNA-directed RNA polymerase subunit delta
MSNQYTLKISPEKAKEVPMVDLAFEVLKAVNTPFYYRDLMQEIAKIKGLSDEEVLRVIAQLYTEINIDGRFACVGTNLWGLKRWYPVDKSEDGVASTTRPRIINDEDDDEEEVFTEEEETYTEQEEDFDAFDEDRADFEEEEEEEEEFFEDEEASEEDSGDTDAEDPEDTGVDEDAVEDDPDEYIDEDNK